MALTVTTTDAQYRSKQECHKRAIRARVLIEQAEKMLLEANGCVIGTQGHRSQLNNDIEATAGMARTLAARIDYLIRNNTP